MLIFLETEPLKGFISFLMFMTKLQTLKNNHIQLNILTTALVLTEETQTYSNVI